MLAETKRVAAAAGGPLGPESFKQPWFTHLITSPRALLASIVTVMLAAIAHMSVAGARLDIAPLIPVVLIVWAVSTWLSQRRVAWWQWLLLLGGAQLSVHVLNSVFATEHGHHGASHLALMLAAHAVSTALTAAVLAFGEKVWWFVSSWLHWQLLEESYQRLAEVRPARFAATHQAARHTWIGAGSLGMRAPPAALFC